MTPQEIQRKEEELSALVREKLSLGGKTLEAQLKTARRKLPKKMIADGVYLSQAARIASNPKLSRQIDIARLERTHARMSEHLEKINPRDRRIGQLLGSLGRVTFILITVFVAVIIVLRWRGFL